MPATPETTATGAPIVFDATVLSNFARIGPFQWLEQIYAGRGWTTLMVVEEIHRGVEAGYSGLETVEHALTPTGWLAVTAADTAEEQSLYTSLLALVGIGRSVLFGGGPDAQHGSGDRRRGCPPNGCKARRATDRDAGNSHPLGARWPSSFGAGERTSGQDGPGGLSLACA